jgi:hypothetical protein
MAALERNLPASFGERLRAGGGGDGMDSANLGFVCKVHIEPRLFPPKIVAWNISVLRRFPNQFIGLLAFLGYAEAACIATKNVYGYLIVLHVLLAVLSPIMLPLIDVHNWRLWVSNLLSLSFSLALSLSLSLSPALLALPLYIYSLCKSISFSLERRAFASSPRCCFFV